MRCGKQLLKVKSGLMILMAFCLVLTGVGVSWAEYPERDIRVIIPYKPGGGSDVRARLLAKVVQDNQLLSEPMVITNIPGGGAAIGQREVLKAKPDGYTLLVHHGQIIIGHLLGLFDWTYHDFAPVAEITENPLLICTHKKKSYKSFKDVLKAAADKPGKITLAWGGMGGHGHFAAEALFQAAGVKFRPLALSGAAEQKAALAGGQLDVAILGVIPVEYIKSGDFIPLAVTSDERIPQLPGVPTLKEQGVDLSVSIRYSMFAPKGTPEDVLERLRTVVGQAVATDEFKEKINAIGAVVKFKPGPDMIKQYDQDARVFGGVASTIKAAQGKK